MKKQGKNFFMPGEPTWKRPEVDPFDLSKKPTFAEGSVIESALGAISLARETDAHNLPLNEAEKEQMAKHFKEWCSSTKECKDYSHLQILGNDKMIVRLYRFECERDSGILDGTGGKIKIIRVLPYVKVLQANTDMVGDILLAPPGLTKMETTKEWLGWQQLILKGGEKQYGDLVEPERYSGLINDWRRDSMFTLNPMEPTEEDNFTFWRSVVNFPLIYKEN
jgi:hypothetical protein